MKKYEWESNASCNPSIWEYGTVSSLKNNNAYACFLKANCSIIMGSNSVIPVPDMKVVPPYMLHAHSKSM